MKAQKIQSRTSLPRIYFIDKKIAAGGFPNSSQLAREWEISISTISRDIEFMRNMLGAPIEYDTSRRGYYYAEKTYRLPAGFTTGDEMLALGLAKNMLDLYKNTPIYEAVNHLFESITAPLRTGNGQQWYENRLVVPPFPTSTIPLATWDIVTNALRKNRIITFDYCGIYNTAEQTRRVHPYQLLFDTGVWHLYGLAEERSGLRMFSLLRMKNIVLTDETFKLPADFDFRTRINGSNFGVFVDDKTYHFKIKFYAESALWIRERQWASDQQIEEIEDGIIIDFTSSQFDKVLQWTLSFGCDAKPIEPQELVDIWAANARKMVKNYENCAASSII
ncbi:MAG: WYL domain-containing protein [Termitinemataceae bacterium]|nr:MAG: WYL domain-containing protein [Termitinemataceae bacterium]